MGPTLGSIVARNLRRLRHERGLSQEELAHRTGVNRNYVGMIEREENSPTVDMIERLCKVLEIDAAVLFRRGKS
jgi:transcriptional regulator with XRE-family HTH domain